MQKKSVLVLSLAEAKEALFDFWADVVVNDRANIRELISKGTPINGHGSPLVPDISNWSDTDIAKQFGDLELGNKLAKENNVDQIVVECKDYVNVVVWDIENVPPDERPRMQ